MRKVVHYLRKKPEKTRKQILHLSTVVLGFILFALWAYSLGTNLGSEETQKKIENNVKPFSVLKDNVPALW